jgi:hypothetical protein
MAKPLFIGPEAVCLPNMVTSCDGTQRVGEAFGSEEGRRAGEEVWEMIREALGKAAEDSRVRAVGECVRRFPRETQRHPEVSEYLEHLSRRGNTAALARILADRPRRGRPARSAEEEFTETAIVEGIVAREGCTVSRAAEVAKREHPDLFGHKTVRSIENDFSRTRDALRVARQHRWIPGRKLTNAAWSPSNNERGKR